MKEIQETDMAVSTSDHDTLIRLETKFDAFALEVRTQNTEITKIASDHEARIRVSEADREQMHGAINAMRAMFLTITTLLLALQVLITWFFGTHR